MHHIMTKVETETFVLTDSFASQCRPNESLNDVPQQSQIVAEQSATLVNLNFCSWIYHAFLSSYKRVNSNFLVIITLTPQNGSCKKN